MISQRLKNMSTHFDNKIEDGKPMGEVEQGIFSEALAEIAGQVELLERNGIPADLARQLTAKGKVSADELRSKVSGS